VPETSAFEIEMAIEKLKRHKSPGIDQIPAGVGQFVLRFISLLILRVFGIRRNSRRTGRIRLLYLFKRRAIRDCSNYRGVLVLSTTYKILSNILLSRLTPCEEEIIWDHQCGFRRNGSPTDHTFCIRQILEKKWECNEAVRQQFIDIKKSYDSVRREVLYNILIAFGIPNKNVSELNP